MDDSYLELYMIIIGVSKTKQNKSEKEKTHEKKKKSKSINFATFIMHTYMYELVPKEMIL